MPRTKLDRRIIKTRRAINTAMLQALNDRNIDAITITEVTTRADINRKTFYLHYTCVEDVVKALEDQFARDFVSAVDASLENGIFVPARFFALVKGAISENAELFRAFCLEKTSQYMVSALENAVLDKLMQVYRPLSTLRDNALRLSLVNMVQGCLHIYLEWVRHPSDVTLDEVTALATCYAEAATIMIRTYRL